MKRNILIFQEGIQTSTIEKYIEESVESGYNLTIVKIVPKFYNGEVYAYTTNKNWLTTILEEYKQINEWHTINYNDSHNILFNIELSINNIEDFIEVSQNHQLPLFVDYFYSNGDKINYENFLNLKNNVKRTDFNHLFSQHINLTTDLESITSICDNYDVYENNKLQSLSMDFILSYINSKNYKVSENIDNIDFKELLKNFHSATPIFMLENDNLSLYLFGFKRFYKINCITQNVLSAEEFLQSTVIYLSKRMSKNYVCSDCEQRNNCFNQGLWLNSSLVDSQEKCIIYLLLKKEL